MSAKTDKTCETCGKVFRVWRYRSNARFCSHPCYGVWRSQNVAGKNHPDYKDKVLVVCKQCGEEFSVHSYRATGSEKAQFCSRACHGTWKRGRNTGADSPCYKERVEMVCEQCGKNFLVYPHQTTGPWKRKFCSRNCRHRYIVGEAHPNWIGGQKGYPTGWSAARNKAHAKGTGSCVLCRMTEEENGRMLDVHHIDYDKNNLSDGNLIELCQSCHTKTNFKRPFWKLVFSRRGHVPPLDWQHRQVMYGN